MNLEEKKDNELWYDNPSIVTWLIILIISIIILSSQSFSINSNVDTLRMFQDVLNHNITYMIALVYFVSLKTKFGKKYFDYINLVMIVVFFILFVTSILTVFQSFNLATLLSLAIHTLLVVYFFHVFMRGTRFWKEFSLDKSPFNELSNEWLFWALVIIEVVLFSVNLITTATFNGTVLATFDCIYIILFSRYIYLYGVYLDSKKINVKNTGNFDEYREKVSEVVSDLGKKSEAIVEDMTSKDDEKSNDSEKSSDTTHKNKDDDKTKKNNKKDKNGEDK
ncbi:unknown [Mycoplasma sp. CAG:877]|nr:unknown [Mycoplasma sp. CAG:877]